VKRHNIVTVVVTYNRLSDLEVAVSSLLQSSRLPNAILVVDNSSEEKVSDSIDGRLREHELTHFLRLSKNLGGAGGFKRGVEYALANLNADILHLMDDDGFVHRQQIEQLEKALDTFDLVNSCVVSSIDNGKLAFGIKNYSQVSDMPDVVRDSVNPFNGTMFSRDLYLKVGGIREDFFIWGDEVDFVKRVVGNKLSVATIKSAIHYHPESKSTFDSILGSSRYLVEVKPRPMFGIFLRNRVYLAKSYETRLYYYKFIFRYLVYFMSKGDFAMLRYLFLKWNPSK
jgi:rhamnopyranosyl-N-acetylglucosaminyl-diphospho-decaprenol beta-1,3/1,4-galactofuranosyltransferase